MNALTFNSSSGIDYFITNVDSSQATAEWIVTTYSQRNWVEVFYREAKGWLGLSEYKEVSLSTSHSKIIDKRDSETSGDKEDCFLYAQNLV